MWWVTLAFGHALEPALLQVDTVDATHVQVRWEPPDSPGADALEPVLVGCTGEGLMECPEGLTRVEIRGLEHVPADVFVQIDGRAGMLTADQPSWEIDRTGWVRQGAVHVLTGWDHLAFVAGVVLLCAKTPKRLVGAVTSFTVGHSLTLALAAVGGVTLSPAVVELGIAGSVLLLAVELGKRDTLTHQYPMVVCGGFGLLHGLGFASALHRPDALALLGFNGGVELAQLAVVAALLWPARAVGQWAVWRYALGTAGAVWTLQRGAAWLL
jgi:hydrogenase/urease accessory protein HupE